jgi:hypothetical protein
MPKNANELEKGILVGISHGTNNSRTPMAAIQKIRMKPEVREGYLEARRQIVKLARRRPGGTVFIEYSPLENDSLTLLARKAEKLGLKVRPIMKGFNVRLNLHANAIESQKLMARMGIPKEEAEFAQLTIGFPQRLLPLVRLPSEEIIRRVYTSFKSADNVVIQEALREAASLIIAGHTHISDIAPALEKAGFTDNTPEKLRRMQSFFDTQEAMGVDIEAIDRQHELRRQRILEKFKQSQMNDASI